MYEREDARVVAVGQRVLRVEVVVARAALAAEVQRSPALGLCPRRASRTGGGTRAAAACASAEPTPSMAAPAIEYRRKSRASARCQGSAAATGPSVVPRLRWSCQLHRQRSSCFADAPMPRGPIPAWPRRHTLNSAYTTRTFCRSRGYGLGLPTSPPATLTGISRDTRQGHCRHPTAAADPARAAWSR